MYLSFLFSFERSCGALAQLGERLLCTQEVNGSIPLSSIVGNLMPTRLVL